MSLAGDRNRQRTRTVLVIIAFVSFTALGMPGGLLGVAWPSAMRTFGASLDDVGAVLIALTVGSLLSSFGSGPAIARIGSGWFLTACSAAAAGGQLLFAFAPAWWMAVASGFLTGVAAGGVDSVLNVYFAENHDSRLMSWLHACFGLGATVGPILITALLAAGHSWQWGYVVVGVVQVLIAGCFALTARSWREPASSSQQRAGQPVRDVKVTVSLRLPIIWVSVGLFLLAAGVESVAGQWPYSLFTEARGIDPTVAGLWSSVYWGAITVGRILYGLAGSRLNDETSLRIGMVAGTVGGAMLWVRSSDLVSFLGLALMGLAISPVFPLLQLLTPRRVGAEHTANAIGFQTATGYVGVGFLPAVAGYLAERQGLETIIPFIVVLSIAMLVLHEVVIRRLAAQSSVQASAATAQVVEPENI